MSISTILFPFGGIIQILFIRKTIAMWNPAFSISTSKYNHFVNSTCFTKETNTENQYLLDSQPHSDVCMIDLFRPDWVVAICFISLRKRSWDWRYDFKVNQKPRLGSWPWQLSDIITDVLRYICVNSSPVYHDCSALDSASLIFICTPRDFYVWLMRRWCGRKWEKYSLWVVALTPHHLL